MKTAAILLACLASLVLLVLAAWPQLDITIAAQFETGPHHFIGHTPLGRAARTTAYLIPPAIFTGALLLYLGRLARLVPSRLGPSHMGMAFLVLSLALGPGLLVNGTLKQMSHRPRPYQTQPLGGPDAFRPFYRTDGICTHNCSFPSGEASSAFWTLAPASLLPPPYRLAAVAAALIFAMATAALRVAAGAHFLSDVAASALLTLLVLIALRAWLARRQRQGILGEAIVTGQDQETGLAPSVSASAARMKGAARL